MLVYQIKLQSPVSTTVSNSSLGNISNGAQGVQSLPLTRAQQPHRAAASPTITWRDQGGTTALLFHRLGRCAWSSCWPWAWPSAPQGPPEQGVQMLLDPAQTQFLGITGGHRRTMQWDLGSGGRTATWLQRLCISSIHHHSFSQGCFRRVLLLRMLLIP